MSQPNSSSSTSAHVSPAVAVRSAHVLSFALLVLVTTIFFFSTVTKSAASSASPLCTIYASKQVGECFDFGRYPQGPNGEIKPIIWRVLQRNADHLLVIAEQILDCKRYNEELCEVTWEACTLRRWLNSAFISQAFNEQERECILQTSIVNNAEPNTEDRIFLLSFAEAESLFANDELRRAKPTESAIKNGVWTYENGCCWWWLRSRGFNGYYASYVGADGFVNVDGIDVAHDDHAVRPAFKIAL